MKADYVEIKPGQFVSKGYAESLRKRGAYKPLGGLGSDQHQPNQKRTLVKKVSARPSRKEGACVIVTFVPFLRVGERSVDEDNFGHSQYKSMRDEFAKGVGIDDGDERIRFEYARPVITKGRPGTLVNITQL